MKKIKEEKNLEFNSISKAYKALWTLQKQNRRTKNERKFKLIKKNILLDNIRNFKEL